MGSPSEQIGKARRLIHSTTWTYLKRAYSKLRRRIEKRAIAEERDENAPKRNRYKGWAD